MTLTEKRKSDTWAILNEAAGDCKQSRKGLERETRSHSIDLSHVRHILDSLDTLVERLEKIRDGIGADTTLNDLQTLLTEAFNRFGGAEKTMQINACLVNPDLKPLELKLRATLTTVRNVQRRIGIALGD